MPTNFMEAGTEIDGLKSKVDQILSKIANEIAEVCVERAKSGKTGNSLENDIANLVKDFPSEYQAEIYLKVIVAITKNMGGSKNVSGSSSKNSSSNIFARRGY